MKSYNAAMLIEKDDLSVEVIDEYETEWKNGVPGEAAIIRVYFGPDLSTFARQSCRGEVIWQRYDEATEEYRDITQESEAVLELLYEAAL